mmetsp:Transcript_30083/g.59742  ORF Transcript_30083/g.59742 Transcript_30083/m.59742 type:complete len:203 (-) Transcript_30083:10-618(-)
MTVRDAPPALPNTHQHQRQRETRPTQAPDGSRPRGRLEAASTATGLPPGRVGGDGGDVLDPANLHAGAGEGAKGGLGSGSGGLGLVAASGADLDVEGGDAEGLALLGDVLGGKHRSVGGGLITVSLDLHATSDTDEGLTAGEISDVNKGVVEGGKKVRDGENLLSVGSLGSEGGLLGDGLVSSGLSHCDYVVCLRIRSRDRN